MAQERKDTPIINPKSIRLVNIGQRNYEETASYFARDEKGSYYIFDETKSEDQKIAGPSPSSELDPEGNWKFINDSRGKWQKVEKPGCMIPIRYPFSTKIEVVEPPKSNP